MARCWRLKIARPRESVNKTNVPDPRQSRIFDRTSKIFWTVRAFFCLVSTYYFRISYVDRVLHYHCAFHRTPISTHKWMALLSGQSKWNYLRRIARHDVYKEIPKKFYLTTLLSSKRFLWGKVFPKKIEEWSIFLLRHYNLSLPKYKFLRDQVQRQSHEQVQPQSTSRHNHSFTSPVTWALLGLWSFLALFDRVSGFKRRSPSFPSITCVRWPFLVAFGLPDIEPNSYWWARKAWLHIEQCS